MTPPSEQELIDAVEAKFAPSELDLLDAIDALDKVASGGAPYTPVRALTRKLRTAYKERDEALARCEKLRELADSDPQQRRMLNVPTTGHPTRKELDQLRTSVLSIAAQIDRAADARAAAVLIGQPPSGAATVYDLRAFAGDLRRAVEAPRDGNT